MLDARRTHRSGPRSTCKAYRLIVDFYANLPLSLEAPDDSHQTLKHLSWLTPCVSRNDEHTADHPCMQAQTTSLSFYECGSLVYVKVDQAETQLAMDSCLRHKASGQGPKDTQHSKRMHKTLDIK